MCESSYAICFEAKVLKRDNERIEEYNQEKIAATLLSLFRTSREVSKEESEKAIISIINYVTLELQNKYTDIYLPVIPTYEIQECLEKALMKLDFYKTLKQCIILGYTKAVMNHSNTQFV